jgi:hypothetical protein
LKDSKTAAQQALETTVPTPKIGVVPPDMTPGWNIQVFNTAGHKVQLENVGLIIGHNPKLGVTFTYGLTLGGFDGLQIHETGGGGAVIVPFFLKGGQCYIGVVEQLRHTQGGHVNNVPRGYRKPGENALENAVREFNEEVGPDTDKVSVEIYPLGGSPVNANSAHYETWGVDEGVKFFTCEISANALEAQEDGSYAFRADMLGKIDDERKKEAIFGAKFIPWDQALALNDAFTVVCVARLLAHLHREDLVTIVI